MKKRKLNSNFYLFLFVLMFGSGALAQDWGILNSGITDGLNDLDFIDESSGLAVGDAGRIIGTVDAGATWTLLSSGTVENLNSVVSITSGIWIVSGDNGTILRTTNSGLTWSPVTSGVTSNLNSISFFDANNGVISGDGGVILTTTDGGASWTSQNSTTTNNLFGNTYTVSGNIYAVGEGLTNPTILVSYNSGSNWSTQASGTLNNLTSVDFVDDNNGFAVGEFGTLLSTTDGGTTWGNSAITTVNLNHLALVNDSVGFTVGDNGVILKTTDYGVTWNALTSNSIESLTSVKPLGELSGYAVGSNGEILRTCPTPAYSSNATDSICEGTTVNFINQSVSAENYLWVVDGDTISTTTDLTFNFDQVGTIEVLLIATNSACENQIAESIEVIGLPVVDLGNDTTICSTCSDTLTAPPGFTYQWFYNGTFNGNVSDVNIATNAGEYVVEVTNSEGCVNSDTINIMMTNSITETQFNASAINIFPNPSNGIFKIEFNEELDTVNYKLLDVTGREIKAGEIKNGYLEIDLSDKSDGIFYLNLSNSKKSITLSLSKI